MFGWGVESSVAVISEGSTDTTTAPVWGWTGGIGPDTGGLLWSQAWPESGHGHNRTARPLGWHSTGQGAPASWGVREAPSFWLQGDRGCTDGSCGTLCMDGAVRGHPTVLEAFGVSNSWQCPQPSCAWEVWSGCVRLFPAAPPVTLRRHPGTRHRFAPARLGLGCGSSTPRPHGTDGNSACLVAVPSRQAVVAGAQSPLQPGSSPPSWAGRVDRR